MVPEPNKQWYPSIYQQWYPSQTHNGTRAFTNNGTRAFTNNGTRAKPTMVPEPLPTIESLYCSQLDYELLYFGVALRDRQCLKLGVVNGGWVIDRISLRDAIMRSWSSSIIAPNLMPTIFNLPQQNEEKGLNSGTTCLTIRNTQGGGERLSVCKQCVHARVCACTCVCTRACPPL